jgi:hypothetical protein
VRREKWEGTEEDREELGEWRARREESEGRGR